MASVNTQFLLLTVGALLVIGTWAQNGFQEEVICYECFDEAHNTTCGEPRTLKDLEELPQIVCKRGACIKWTFYRRSILMLQRTCSEQLDIHIPLNQVCRTERYGNGYLCMCAGDMCNSATTYRLSLWTLLLTTAAVTLTSSAFH